MTKIFLAFRSALYASAFTVLWGWLSLRVRAAAGDWFILPPETRPIGVAFLIIGGALAVWCIFEFFRVGGGTPAPFDPPRALVQSGPYRYVRNPMYLGGMGALVGFGLWNSSATMVLFSIGFIVLAHFLVIFYEEPILERQFGSRYLIYKTLVGRWLPKKQAIKT